VNIIENKDKILLAGLYKERVRMHSYQFGPDEPIRKARTEHPTPNLGHHAAAGASPSAPMNKNLYT
jgi:hypothetical protein